MRFSGSIVEGWREGGWCTSVSGRSTLQKCGLPAGRRSRVDSNTIKTVTLIFRTSVPTTAGVGYLPDSETSVVRPVGSVGVYRPRQRALYTRQDRTRGRSSHRSR